MKHLKKHPVTEPKNQLSKDMKKQDHVKSPKDKILDADKSLSKKPRIPRKQNKPSNRKLDGEKFLASDEKQTKRSAKPSNKKLDGENFLSEGIGDKMKWGFNKAMAYSNIPILIQYKIITDGEMSRTYKYLRYDSSTRRAEDEFKREWNMFVDAKDLDPRPRLVIRSISYSPGTIREETEELKFQ